MHIHVVKRGDTLSSIAAMHDALPAFVAADNGLTLSTPLVIGQALVVRTPKTLHTVRVGETLSSIARDYDLSVRTLLRRNFFLHGRELLREGDVLAIDYADEAPLGTLGVNAYAYPYIGGELLRRMMAFYIYFCDPEGALRGVYIDSPEALESFMAAAFAQGFPENGKSIRDSGGQALYRGADWAYFLTPDGEQVTPE